MIFMEIEIDDILIDCNIQYGKGKKLLINIDETGFITVKAPNNTSKEEIADAIKQHGKLIKEKLNEISRIKERPRTRSYDEQGKFLHLGKEYFLQELIDTDGLGEEELKANLKKFYISSCKKIVAERIKIYQGQLGVKPKIIEVDESKTKWGSCNSDKKITFNYKLAMAPIEAIDYVVVHELCHLLHMNHDRSFWRRLGSILPDYKKRQELLSRFGNYMII
jgi:predicted metal-dependent hydrolase